MTTIVSDAWRLWRTDWSILVAIAGPFLFLPPLAMNLLLEPDLERTMAAIAPNDGQAQVQALFAFYQSSALWLVLLQAVTQFGLLAILSLYLGQGRATVAEALRTAALRFPVYLLTSIMVSIIAMAGLILLIIGFIYALARLSMVGPVIVAEGENNPFAAIGRSLTLTRGSGMVLMAIIIVGYCATIFLQIPFEQIGEWMATHAPNPVPEAIVAMIVSALSAAFLLATGLVQAAAYRRFTASSGPSFSDIFR